MNRFPEGYINPKRAASLAAFAAALPGTHRQIIERSGLSKTTVGTLIAELHGKNIRVAKWLPHPVRGPSIAVYAKGTAPDAVDTLPRVTKRQAYERYEARIKGTITADIRLAKHRSRYWEKKAARTPNAWASALFAGVRVPTMNAEG